jgi:acetyltransferase-like isoleucine patch superfamily enzyme
MRNFLKHFANLLAVVAAMPAVLAYRAASAMVGRHRALPGWSQAFSLLPGIGGVYLRRAFYRLTLPRCGENATVGFGTIFADPDAQIGRDVYIGAFCCLGNVVLEDDVLLASCVSIVNGGRQHGVDDTTVPIREQPGVMPRVTIGRDSWIGERAVVMADVGRHCVVGAGAVVTRPIPDCAVAVGVPAAVIRYRVAEGEHVRG